MRGAGHQGHLLAEVVVARFATLFLSPDAGLAGQPSRAPLPAFRLLLLSRP